MSGVCIVGMALVTLLFLPELPLRRESDGSTQPAN
jgi:hypothetical protein